MREAYSFDSSANGGVRIRNLAGCRGLTILVSVAPCGRHCSAPKVTRRGGKIRLAIGLEKDSQS